MIYKRLITGRYYKVLPMIKKKKKTGKLNVCHSKNRKSRMRKILEASREQTARLSTRLAIQDSVQWPLTARRPLKDTTLKIIYSCQSGASGDESDRRLAPALAALHSLV